MSNSLFQELGGGQMPQGAPRNFAPALLQHIRSFRGNPLEVLQSKLSSGEMSQEQYNQLHSAAEAIAQRMMQTIPRR